MDKEKIIAEEMNDKKENYEHCELVKKIKNAVKVLDELDAYMETISVQQQEIDYKLSDMAHYIEFFGDSIKMRGSQKILRQYSKDRNIRRMLNVENDIRNTYKSYAQRLCNMDNRKFLMQEIYKTEKNWDTVYQYRVYKEDKLKEMTR